MDTKSTFKGRIISIQPRIRLMRSFDEASHTYLGYAITLDGEIDTQNTTFSVGIGKAAHAKHQFKVNDVISGECVPVPDPDTEPTEYYKVSKLKVISSGTITNTSSPWELVPPELKFTEKEDIAGWQPGHMRFSVVAVCGAVECLLRLL